jgi:UDP-GlcNAc:undecaprenyl-phosphate/decaprenyl-phosphate GlcNAc-1-phosphate transferase
MAFKISILILILLNFLIIFYHKNISKFINIYDYPDNIRKFQKNPIPLIGGFIFYFNLLFFSIFLSFSDNFFIKNIWSDYKSFLIFIFFSTIVFIFGIYDDVKKINPNIKLLITVLIILSFCYWDKTLIINNLRFSFFNKDIILNNFAVPFTILCCLLFINAFNMFDGLDLQCTLYSIFIFILLFLAGLDFFFVFLMIPLIFFLYLNINKYSYLGNSGSILLSFTIAVLIIKSYNNNNIQFSDRIFLIMCIPGFDLLRLAIFRIYKKKHPFYPDNNHLHHIVYKKFNFAVTTLIIQAIIIIPNFLYFANIPVTTLIFLSLFFYIIIVFFMNKFFKNSY